MNELRWILLGAGVVLLVGIYAWGRRSARRSAAPGDGRDGAAEIPPVKARGEAKASGEFAVTEPAGTPQLTRTREKAVPVAGEEPRSAVTERRREPATRSEPPGRREAAARREPTLGRNVEDGGDAGRTPTIGRAAEPAAATPPGPSTDTGGHGGERAAATDEAPPADDVARPRQRIVALRVTAPLPTRFSGVQLLEALEAEGMEFGRFDIFHKLDGQGRPLYSLANLLEPGTFDMATLREGAYPGVAVFAVVPGPLPAAEVFDQMLGAARSLASRLGGSLQDERGAWLSAQRVASLRDELVALERGLADRSGH